MIGLQRSRTFEDSNVEIDVFYDYEIWGRDFLGRRSFQTSFIQKEKVYTVPTCTTDLYDGAFEVSKHDGTNPITGYTIQSGSWLAPAHREERSDGVFIVNPHAVQGLMLGTFDSNATFWVGDREPPCEGDIDLDDFEVERSLLYKYVEHSSCGEQEWCAVIGSDSGVAPTPVIVEPTHRVLVDDQRYVFITADPEYPEPGVYSYGYRVCTTASGDDKVCSAQVTPRPAMHQYP